MRIFEDRRRYAFRPLKPWSREGFGRAMLALVLFYLAAQFGFLFTDGLDITPVWPPVAVALVFALFYGPGVLWAVMLYVAYDFIVFNPTDVGRYPFALVEPLGILAGALITPAMLRALRFNPALESIRDAILFVATSALHPVITSTVATLGYCGLMHGRTCLRVGWSGHFFESWVGDVFGLWICMPALLSWLLRFDPLARRTLQHPDDFHPMNLKPGIRQARFLIATVLALGAMMLLARRVTVPVELDSFIAVPLLIWAALRFEPLLVHTAILVVGLGTMAVQLVDPATARAVLGPGPRVTTHFLALFSFSFLSLLVSIAMTSQQRLAARLADLNASLEDQVRERTRDLDAAVSQLITTLDEREKLVERLDELANSDSLTRLLNRRAFFEQATRLAARRQTQPLAIGVLLFDVDHFKKINDAHGHDAGDCALVRLAASCKLELRADDTIARLGGEEFAVLLPYTSIDEAAETAERLRQAITRIAIPMQPGDALSFTASFGATDWLHDETIEQALSRADAALYAAKRAGRDRVVVGRGEGGVRELAVVDI